MKDHTNTLKQGLDAGVRVIGTQLSQIGFAAAQEAILRLQEIIEAHASLDVKTPVNGHDANESASC